MKPEAGDMYQGSYGYDLHFAVVACTQNYYRVTIIKGISVFQ
jgi:hypothetical protein